ncbi:protein of unknown function DUF1725 containing protein [Cricetulus griseus]|nr:protein of unknown function DUF1725 containing protein [Cricetulus griseus]
MPKGKKTKGKKVARPVRREETGGQKGEPGNNLDAPQLKNGEKMWYIYMMEYYQRKKNNGTLKFTGKWMELEETILNEKLFSFIRSVKNCVGILMGIALNL